MAYKITDDCIGCTLCAKNCPVKAITGALKQKHTIDPDKCVSCGLCGRLCAKGAIEKPDGSRAAQVPKEKWPKPVINREECVGCSLCVEDCPKFCLELSGPRYHGDLFHSGPQGGLHWLRYMRTQLPHRRHKHGCGSLRKIALLIST